MTTAPRPNAQGAPSLVVLRGELDMGTAPVAQQKLDAATVSGSGDVVVEMSEVEFIDSFGLGVLVDATERLRSAGRDLRLRSVPPKVLRLLELTSLERYLRVDLDDPGS